MNCLILDANFDQVAIIDEYKSFIWTDRYCEAGDFELYLPVETNALPYLQIGNYVEIADSDRYMIIDTVEVTTDVDAGDMLLVSGKSLEYILDRRIVWHPTELQTNLEDAVKEMIEANIINPTDPSRKIPNFTFKDSGDDVIKGTNVNTAYFGKSLYEATQGLCGYADCGFKVLPVKYQSEIGFEFQLYRGVNRSYSQEEIPWVAFSNNFDNLLSSRFYSTDTKYKTVCLAIWDGEELLTQEATRKEGAGEGLNRREMATEVVDLGVEMEWNENGLTDEQREKYKKIIYDKGRDSLYPHKVTDEFEGELDTTKQYVYERDFFVGDIVEVRNQYGMSASARLVELVRTCDDDGYRTITTFEVV